ncbi:MAG: hypothetical protein AAFR59_06685, partial [Bacteroidota bacterium]
MNKWLNIQTIRLLLGIIFVLILANIYRVGTAALEHGQMQEQQELRLTKVTQKEQKLAEQQQVLEWLNEVAQKQGNPNLKIQDALDLGRYVESIAAPLDLKVIALPQGQTLQIKGYNVLESNFQLEGSYLDVVRFIHQFEQIDRAGVVHRGGLHHQKYRSGGKAREILVTTLHVRTV